MSVNALTLPPSFPATPFDKCQAARAVLSFSPFLLPCQYLLAPTFILRHAAVIIPPDNPPLTPKPIATPSIRENDGSRLEVVPGEILTPPSRL